MIIQILIIFSLIGIVFSLVFMSIILYHFKRFGFLAEPDTQKIVHIFRFGTAILILLNVVFLLLILR